jgi:hypothetical protein
MLERRQFPRTRVFKGAKLTLVGGLTVDCTVCNLSNHGAYLQLSSNFALAAEFDLSFDGCRTFRKCHKIWQTFTNVGVSFQQAAA